MGRQNGPAFSRKICSSMSSITFILISQSIVLSTDVITAGTAKADKIIELVRNGSYLYHLIITIIVTRLYYLSNESFYELLLKYHILQAPEVIEKTHIYICSSYDNLDYCQQAVRQLIYSSEKPHGLLSLPQF